MHAGLDRAQHLRIKGQGRTRHQDLLAIARVVIGTVRRKAGHLVARLQVTHALTHCGHDPRHLLTDTGGQTSL